MAFKSVFCVESNALNHFHSILYIFILHTHTPQPTITASLKITLKKSQVTLYKRKLSYKFLSQLCNLATLMCKKTTLIPIHALSKVLVNKVKEKKEPAESSLASSCDKRDILCHGSS